MSKIQQLRPALWKAIKSFGVGGIPFTAQEVATAAGVDFNADGEVIRKFLGELAGQLKRLSPDGQKRNIVYQLRRLRSERAPASPKQPTVISIFPSDPAERIRVLEGLVKQLNRPVIVTHHELKKLLPALSRKTIDDEMAALDYFRIPNVSAKDSRWPIAALEGDGTPAYVRIDTEALRAYVRGLPA